MFYRLIAGVADVSVPAMVADIGGQMIELSADGLDLIMDPFIWQDSRFEPVVRRA